MVGVIQTAESSVSTFRKVSQLKQNIELQIAVLGRKRKNANKLLSYLFSQPIVSALEVAEVLDVSVPTSNALLKTFTNLGILKEKTGYAPVRESKAAVKKLKNCFPPLKRHAANPY